MTLLNALVRSCLLPEKEMRGLRELTRYRKNVIEARSRAVQR